MVAIASAAGGTPEALPSSQGRIEVVLAETYKPELSSIRRDFEEAGLSNVHIQFMRQGHPPTNIGLGTEIPAERARAAIRLAKKYNNAVTILLPEHLFPSSFITIASSNFDEKIEVPIGAETLRQLEDPRLTTRQFHDLYRYITSSRP
jgi:hypothetical protein